jgi:hypothetical protein
MAKNADAGEKWGSAFVRANVKKPRPRAKTFLSVKRRAERNLEIGTEELSEAIEGLASLANVGDLPAGIGSDDIDHVQTHLMIPEDDLDNPIIVTKHMNRLPSISTRWGMIGVRVERALDEITREHDRWVAEAKIGIRDVLFQKSRDEGATANNSVPTKSDIEAQFLVLYNEDEGYIQRRQMMKDMEHVKDYISIIVKSIDKACDMIQNIGHMNRMMVEQGAIIVRNRKGENESRRQTRKSKG